MRQIDCSKPCLHVYCVGSGSWTNIPLDSRDLPRLVEVVTPIFSEDGIATSIETRLEFGHFVTDLLRSLEEASRHCWISFPAHTVLSELELYRTMREAGRSEVTFDGSPLTLVLGKLLSEYDLGSIHGAWFEFRHLKVSWLEFVVPGTADHMTTHCFHVEIQDILDILLPLLRTEEQQQTAFRKE
uniref:Uncharacterized protein n=1 Tax=Leviviridae sp. TaxID=2027243 RepID=A0A514DAY6_9VIRU|nr:MAG: hypothetical protein H2RhizoL4917005_000001 [Leviviridae sp.]